MVKHVDSQCHAFKAAIEVLGRPWNALILNVLQSKPHRFSELSAAAQGPGDKMLSARLKDLEAKGLLSRQVEPGPPVRVTYSLTDQGRQFSAVAEAIEKWGRTIVSAEARASRARRAAAR